MSVLICHAKTILSIAKDFATLLGALSALVYFGYKVFAGWLLLNMTVGIETERQSAPDEDDHLVVKIALSKGKVDSVRLLSAELRLTAAERNDVVPLSRPIASMQRIRFPRGGPAQWSEPDSGNPTLTLSTEETIHLCEHFRVTPGVVYRVEAVVQGDRFRDRLFPSLSQWRGVAIALPTKTASN